MSVAPSLCVSSVDRLGSKESSIAVRARVPRRIHANMCSCARRRSCTPTSTRSTRRSSSATIRGCAAGPVIVGGGCRARGELRGEGVRRPHGDGRARRPAGCARRRSSSRRGCRPTPRRARRCSRCSTTRRRWSRGCRSTRRSSTSAGCGGSSGTPTEIAARLRRDVLERVGLPITVGVARTKFLAKVASGVAKPDGLLVVPPDGELDFLHPLPVERLWGVGPVTADKLHDRGHHDRRRGRRGSPRRRSSSMLGRGVGPAPPRARAQPRPAAGAGRPPPALDRLAARARPSAARSPDDDRRRRSSALVDRVTRRMRAAGRVGRTVVLRLRFDDFSRATRSHTLPRATAQTADDPRHGARRCWPTADAADRAAGPHAGRRRGRATSTTTAPSSSRCRSIAHSGGALDAALDEVRDRFGSAAVTRAVLLGRDPGLLGAAAARLSRRPQVRRREAGRLGYAELRLQRDAQREQLPVGTRRADQRHADGEAASPDAGREGRHGEARPVPEVRQRDQDVVGAGVLVAVTAQRSDNGNRRLDEGGQPVLIEPRRPGMRHLPAADLRRDVGLAGHGPTLAFSRPTRATPAGRARAARRNADARRASPWSGRRGSRRRCRRSRSAVGRRRASPRAGDRPRAPGRSRPPRPDRARLPATRGETARRTPIRGRRPSRGPGMPGGGAWRALSAAPAIGAAHRRSSRPQSTSVRAIGPGVVEAPGQRDDPRQRDAPARGLDRRRAAARRRDAQRARRVGAGGGGNHAARRAPPPTHHSSHPRSARAPTGCRPGRSCRRRRTRACADARAGPCPPRRGGSRRRSPPREPRRAGGSTR